MRIMKLADIKITEAFANTIPRPEKMETCRKYWNENGKQDRYIVVNDKGYLVDGYIQYLICKEYGVEEVEVVNRNSKKIRYRRKRETDWDMPTYRSVPTTYVYGYHPKTDRHEYVWRIPNNWIWMSENIQIGDTVYGRTKFGVAPVIITKIEIMNKCPFEGTVKKICSQTIRRNGKCVE